MNISTRHAYQARTGDVLGLTIQVHGTLAAPREHQLEIARMQVWPDQVHALPEPLHALDAQATAGEGWCSGRPGRGWGLAAGRPGFAYRAGLFHGFTVGAETYTNVQ